MKRRGKKIGKGLSLQWKPHFKLCMAVKRQSFDKLGSFHMNGGKEKEKSTVGNMNKIGLWK